MAKQRIPWDDPEAAAKLAVGNWRSFECFYWNTEGRLDNPDNYFITYTHHRDSTLLPLSNAAAIEKMMKKYIGQGTAWQEEHSSWLVGWMSGWIIQVYTKRKKPTAAFRAWCEIQQKLSDYPVLDEDDYYEREYQATIENIKQAVQYCHEPGVSAAVDALEDGWEYDLYYWLSNNNESEIESRDDSGAWPSDTAIREAFADLGWLDDVHLTLEEQLVLQHRDQEKQMQALGIQQLELPIPQE